jgi:hypothetical protein
MLVSAMLGHPQVTVLLLKYSLYEVCLEFGILHNKEFCNMNRSTCIIRVVGSYGRKLLEYLLGKPLGSGNCIRIILGRRDFEDEQWMKVALDCV